MSMRWFIISLALVALTVPGPIEAGPSKKERAQLKSRVVEVSPGFSIVKFGDSVFLGLGLDEEASCPFYPEFVGINKDKVRINYQKSGLGSISAEIAMDEGIVQLRMQNPDIKRVHYLISLNCLYYWMGSQEEWTYLRTKTVLDRHLTRLSAGDPAKRDMVLLMDSPIRVYRDLLIKRGATNADDIYDQLVFRRLDANVLTEKTNIRWVRSSEVIELLPKLIVIHFSSFEADKSVLNPCSYRDLDNHCAYLFFNLMKEGLEAGIQFIVYTRTPEICNPPQEKKEDDPTFRSQFAKRLTADLAVDQGLLDSVALFQVPIDGNFAVGRKTGQELAKLIETMLVSGTKNATEKVPDACPLTKQ
jgi:hypothetical protein